METMEKGRLWNRHLHIEERGVEMMVSKAQQKAVNKYIAEKLDRINLTMPKGKKEAIKAFATASGVSVNCFINRAVDEKMARGQEGGAPNE